MSTEKTNEEKIPEDVEAPVEAEVVKEVAPAPEPSPPKSPLDILFTHLKSRDFRKKNEAIKKLGKIKDQKARDKLFEIAQSSEWKSRLRECAVDSLGRGGRDPKLFKFLQTMAVDQKQSKEIRRSCITQLTKYRDPKSISTFAQAMKDPYRFIRFWAVRGLIKIQDPKAIAALVFGLGDDDEEIRKEVRDYLERIGEEAVPGLIKAFTTPDGKKLLRYGSVGLLGRVTTLKSHDALIQALNDPDERVVVIAIRGLARMQNIDSILPLIESYKSGDDRRRKLTEDALFRITQENTKLSVYLLVSLLVDPVPELPLLAKSLFKKIPNSYSHLGDLVNDPEIHPLLKEQIKKILDKL